MENLLRIENLTIAFPEKDGMHTVVDHVNLNINKGEIVGIVGESGSGKSMTSLAVMGLLSEEARVLEGSIQLNGQELLTMSREERRKIQGKNMAMIFQEPMTSLNPVMKIGAQVGESLKLHTDLDKDTIHKKVIEVLDSVGLMDPEGLADKYPHQLSGGMRQRVMIAMAIINNPDLIIADEPTTALDVTVQAQILNLLKKIHKVTGSSILFISHDLNVIKEVCQRVVVMYQGIVVESGDVYQVLRHPKHEYTKKLVASMPDEVSKQVSSNVLLHVSDLNVYYNESKRFFSDKKERKHVVHNMSFDLYDGEILGVVGESGCGKSTLAKTIVGLNKEYDGIIEMDGLKPQMVFQDPFSSLNPARKIGWIMEEPLKLKGMKDKQKRRELVLQMLDDIGLDASYANRYARELSGGQRQRISIGLALMRGEKLIIADEPVSALDVTVQSQILSLLIKLHDEKKLTYMFISHDLNIVRHMCHRVIVMYLGQIVEMADVEELYNHPCHPYTKMLFDCILTDEEKKMTDSVAVNEVLSTTGEQQGGCPFYRRCRYRGEKCLKDTMDLMDIGSAGHPHLVRCERIEYGKKYSAAD
ncbi:MAG: dipeptide ABC transporter ATP-binding protein [Coprococcus sp.]